MDLPCGAVALKVQELALRRLAVARETHGNDCGWRREIPCIAFSEIQTRGTACCSMSRVIVLDPAHSTSARPSENTGITNSACCKPVALNASVIVDEPDARAAWRAKRSLSLPIAYGPNEAPPRYITRK